MASAGGDQQEPCGTQLVVSDGPYVRGGGQEMPQDALDPFQHDLRQQEPGGSELALPDGQQVPGGGDQMPERFTIGTTKAFQNNRAFPYEKRQIDSEVIYVCDKGSEWARPNEVLVLRCVEGTWTAFDSEISADGERLQCRQQVFRCLKTDITRPGRYKWETNYAASRTAAGLLPDWQGELWAETRVP